MQESRPALSRFHVAISNPSGRSHGDLAQVAKPFDKTNKTQNDLGKQQQAGGHAFGETPGQVEGQPGHPRKD
jgi:hypothetical protein